MRHALRLLIVFAAVFGTPLVATARTADMAPEPGFTKEVYYFRMWMDASWGVSWKMHTTLRGPCDPCGGSDSPCGEPSPAGGSFRYDYKASGFHKTKMELRGGQALDGIRVKITRTEVNGSVFIALQVHPADANRQLQVPATATVERQADVSETPLREDCDVTEDRRATLNEVKRSGCGAIARPKSSFVASMLPPDSSVIAADVDFLPFIPSPPSFKRCTFIGQEHALTVQESGFMSLRDLRQRDEFKVIGVSYTDAEIASCPWKACAAKRTERWKLEFARENKGTNW